MTNPDKFDDVNESVGSEWEDETTPFERVHDVIGRSYTGVLADNVAETARTSPETARNHLEELTGEGFVQTKTGEDGTTTYRRAPRSIVLEQAREILDNTTTGELTTRVDEIRDRVDEVQPDDEDSESVREWQATRRNLAFVNAALAIDEAARVVDEDEIDAEIEELARELADRVDKD